MFATEGTTTDTSGETPRNTVEREAIHYGTFAVPATAGAVTTIDLSGSL